MRRWTVLVALCAGLFPAVAGASADFEHFFDEIGENHCAVSGAWAIYESPYSGQPEFIGLREVPLIAAVAAYQFSSKDDAEVFSADAADIVAEFLKADRYLGAAGEPLPFAFPDFDESSSSFQFVVEPDAKSLHTFTIYLSVVVIQRGDIVSIVMNYNSMPDLASEFLWDVIGEYDQRWSSETTDVSDALPLHDEYEEPYAAEEAMFGVCDFPATPDN